MLNHVGCRRNRRVLPWRRRSPAGDPFFGTATSHSRIRMSRVSSCRATSEIAAGCTSINSASRWVTISGAISTRATINANAVVGPVGARGKPAGGPEFVFGHTVSLRAMNATCLIILEAGADGNQHLTYTLIIINLHLSHVISI